MANTANSFAFLSQIGSGQAPSAASKKKKNKKGKQGQEEGQGGAQVGDAASNGEVLHQQDAVVEVGEACAILDKAARTFKSGSDRLKLWKDWMKQVRSGGAR